MKYFIAVVSMLLTSATWAHGPVSVQAVEAVKVSVGLFNTSQPNSVRSQFKSLSAEMTGHEQVSVVISLKTGATFTYDCAENETVNPVVWECRAH